MAELTWESVIGKIAAARTTCVFCEKPLRKKDTEGYHNRCNERFTWALDQRQKNRERIRRLNDPTPPPPYYSTTQVRPIKLTDGTWGVQGIGDMDDLDDIVSVSTRPDPVTGRPKQWFARLSEILFNGKAFVARTVEVSQQDVAAFREAGEAKVKANSETWKANALQYYKDTGTPLGR